MMSSPSATVPYSSILPEGSPATPDSSNSFLETSQSSDQLIVPSSKSETFQWFKPFDDLCQWTNKTVKVTRQYLQERFGQISRTHDFQLEEKIQNFYSTKVAYEKIWRDAQQMSKHFGEMIETQEKLKECFFQLEERKVSTDEELRGEFLQNGRCQQLLVDRGFRLLDALRKFDRSLETLISKTMEDTLNTIQRYEKSRIEYDVYRADYEDVLSRNHTGGISLSTKEVSIEEKYSRAKDLYEKYQKDVQVKLNLLDENRVKVMKEQLEEFQRAMEKYFRDDFYPK